VATHPGLYPLERDLEQVYLCLGTQGVAAGDPRRFPVSMLHLLLGGNMSSRLFQVIREQLGLAYSIYAFTSFFSDAGLLGIGAGVSPRNLEAIMAAIGQELNKFQNEPVSAAELAAAREYVRGSVFLAAEDCDHLMMRLAKNELNFGHYIPLDDIVQGLLKVSAQEIQTLAQEMFQPEKWGAAFLGPVDGDKKGGNFLAF
jgi:predicted Zn-dependent peptidase